MRLEYTQQALEQLTDLPVTVRDRVANKLDFYAAQDDPLQFAEHLTGFRAYRFRIGMYRAFCHTEDGVLFIVSIRKRDKAYKGLE